MGTDELIRFKGTFSPKIHAWYFNLKPGKVARTISEHHPYIVDVNNTGEVIGIEILDSSVDMRKIDYLRKRVF